MENLGILKIPPLSRQHKTLPLMRCVFTRLFLVENNSLLINCRCMCEWIYFKQSKCHMKIIYLLTFKWTSFAVPSIHPQKAFSWIIIFWCKFFQQRSFIDRQRRRRRPDQEICSAQTHEKSFALIFVKMWIFEYSCDSKKRPVRYYFAHSHSFVHSNEGSIFR